LEKKMRTNWAVLLIAMGCGADKSGGSTSTGSPEPDTGQEADTDTDTDTDTDADDSGDPPAPFGLDERPSNSTCHAPARPESGTDARLGRVFWDVGFTQPIAMQLQPSDDRYWFMAEQDGDIWRFDNDLSSQVQTKVLDISHRLNTGFEMGLLGMVLHPDFADNGYLYTYVTDSTGGALISRLSRFEWHAGSESFETSSETVLMELTQPYSNHNGGQLAFGPDGLLYWGLGDGGSAGDPLGNGQNTDTLLGSILRIDVDGGSPYAIPADNPFALGGGEPEIYAWGLRNPWAFHFDPATGSLWVGDVGQYSWEEIDRVERGGNYGWNLLEGDHCYAVTPCDDPDLIGPIIEYPNPGSASVVGGPVYQGELVPSLQGTVLYSDFYTGELWGIEQDPMSGEVSKTLFASQPGTYFSGFGQDDEGEVYLHSYYDGAIYRVEAGTGVPAETIPVNLSETGCVDPDDPAQPAEALIPYGINAPLWSDGADKQRWMALPDGETITIADDGQLEFPVGTVLVKQFSKDDVLLETRLLVRHEDGDWGGYAYAWNEAGTAAQWERGGAALPLEDGHWTVPTMSQCMQCHTDAVARTLGLELQQLQGQFTYPGGLTRDQLGTLEHIGLFTDSLPDGIAALPAVDDAGASLEDRARAVLHANCAGCHQEGGTGGSEMDLRFATPLAAMGACGVLPDAGTLGVSGAELLRPGAPDQSMIAVRMGTRGAGSMPPVGTSEVDDAGLGVVREWISAIEDCP
jgi:uncharacterized repeat protein (TIGR03806 family)